MLFKSLIAGSALLAAADSAMAGSSAKCSYTSVTRASASSRDAVKVVVKELDVALCGDGPSEDYVYGIAKKTAYAFASAVAKINVECEATGNGKFRVNGMSAAEAQAKAVAKAFAVGITTSTNCKTCKAATVAIAKAMDTVYADATAELMIDIRGRGDDAESQKITVDMLASAYERKAAKAFAKVVLEAKASDKKCTSKSTAIASAGDDYQKVTCKLNTKAYSKTVVVDALAVAIGGAATKTCFATDRQTLYVQAKAYAEAYALAVTEASGGCFVKGNKDGALGCVKGSAEITAVATGVAKAFAAGVAKAVSKCGRKCYLDEAKLAGALATVSVKAYSDIHVAQCTKYGYGFSGEVTKRKLVGATVEAVAKLLITTAADFRGRCVATVQPTAEIKPGETTEATGDDAKLPTFPEFKGGNKGRRGNNGRRATGGRRNKGGKRGGPRRKVNKTVNKGKRVSVGRGKFSIAGGKAVTKRVLRRRKD